MAESVQVTSVIWNRPLPGGRADHRHGRAFEFIITESALRFRLGPPMRLAQTP
ncbi:MAG: hypothetical protein HKP61_10740, partial [Dactylosporangium sp.]|nr:hypothetical protein [Dactylosporangium sp.]